LLPLTLITAYFALTGLEFVVEHLYLPGKHVSRIPHPIHLTIRSKIQRQMIISPLCFHKYLLIIKSNSLCFRHRLPGNRTCVFTNFFEGIFAAFFQQRKTILAIRKGFETEQNKVAKYWGGRRIID